MDREKRRWRKNRIRKGEGQTHTDRNCIHCILSLWSSHHCCSLHSISMVKPSLLFFVFYLYGQAIIAVLCILSLWSSHHCCSMYSISMVKPSLLFFVFYLYGQAIIAVLCILSLWSSHHCCSLYSISMVLPSKLSVSFCYGLFMYCSSILCSLNQGIAAKEPCAQSISPE